MPVISGTHYCTKCNKEMYWEKYVHGKHYGVETFTYSRDSYSVTLLNDPASEEIKLRIVCDKCNQIDFFSYDNRK